MSTTDNPTRRTIVSPWTESMKAAFINWVDTLPLDAEGDIAPGLYDFSGFPLALVDHHQVSITMAWIHLGWPLGLDDKGEMLYEKPGPSER
jgi:hypothetical protein